MATKKKKKTISSLEELKEAMKNALPSDMEGGTETVAPNQGLDQPETVAPGGRSVAPATGFAPSPPPPLTQQGIDQSMSPIPPDDYPGANEFHPPMAPWHPPMHPSYNPYHNNPAYKGH
jgi:hypothetical protein